MDRFRTIASAVLMAVGYQFFWPLMLVGLIPLLFTSWQPYRLFLWGSVYMASLHMFLISLHDDSHLMVALCLWGVTSLGYAMIYGLFGWLSHAVLYTWLPKTNIRLEMLQYIRHPWAFLPLVWPLIELTKSSGSFGNPNGNLGFGLAPIGPWIGIYSIIGHVGVSMIIVMVNGLLIQAIKHKKFSTWLILFFIFLLCVTLRSPNSVITHPIHASIIQTSLTQPKKTQKSHWPILDQHYPTLVNNSTGNLIVLPETIIPTDIQYRSLFNQLQTLSNTQKKGILFGSFIKEGNNTFNGSYFMLPSQATQIYKKQQLMPFGETLPLRPVLSALIPDEYLFNDFTKGTKTILMPFHTLFIRPIICLEAIYGRFYKAPPNSVIAIMANNAWFNQSSAGNKLRQFAQIYAIEYQTMVLLSSNFGQSAVVGPRGRILQLANHQNTSILTHPIQTTPSSSFYESSPYVGVVCLFFFWIAILSTYLKPLQKLYTMK